MEADCQCDWWPLDKRAHEAQSRDAAGDGGLTPHDLRHYAASVMIEAGCSVKVVQHHLGHAKASTTLDTYAHLWPDSEDTTRRVLEAVLERIVSHACHAVAVSE